MNHQVKLKGKMRSYLQTPLYLTGVLFVAAVLAGLILKSPAFVGLILVFTVIYGLLTGLMYRRNQEAIAEEIIHFAANYASVQKNLLREFEVPYGILDTNGKILWANDHFRETTEISAGYRKSVTTIFPNLTREYLGKIKDEAELFVEFGSRNLRICLKRIQFSEFENNLIDVEDPDRCLIAVYLFDETELTMYKSQIKNSMMLSALVYIDGLEDALESVEDVKKSVLIAMVDRKVGQYFNKRDALVRKVEKDKYFVVFRREYLAEMEKDGFRILEEVKNIKYGSEGNLSLSIGIGFSGEGYNENYVLTRAAMDLALGRGGDQVVIKAGDEIRYYGTSVKQVESRTRVKARVKAQALQEMMEACENLLVMGHQMTDIDSLGAAVGVFCAARSIGRQAQIVIDARSTSIKPLMETFTVEKGYPADMFISSQKALELVNKKTLVMVVDTNRPSYTECPELLRKTTKIVVFDHHRTGLEVVKNPTLSYIEPYASSACEMVAEVLQYFNEGVRLNATESDCLYAGILIDTNNFMTKTGVRTFEAAAFLKRSGADVTRVRKMMRNDMSAYKARAEAVRSAEVYRNSFAISVCPSENLESPTIVGAQAANELLNIIGIRAAFVLTEFKGRIFISARSIDEINVQRVMERLGGGGHLNTAGAQLVSTTVTDARHLLKVTLDEMMEKGEIK